MNRICYMVTATLPDARTADEFAAWLASGHVQQVIRGGADSGMVVRLDADQAGNPRVMAHYTFPSRQVFDEYITQHAPALRAEGLARFPPERGVAFERRVGEIVHE